MAVLSLEQIMKTENNKRVTSHISLKGKIDKDIILEKIYLKCAF